VIELPLLGQNGLVRAVTWDSPHNTTPLMASWKTTRNSKISIQLLFYDIFYSVSEKNKQINLYILLLF
jgi:hypothetical protein